MVSLAAGKYFLDQVLGGATPESGPTDVTVNLANPGQTSLGVGVLQAANNQKALQVWSISKDGAVHQHNQKAASQDQIRVGDVILGISNATKKATTSSELAAQLGNPKHFTENDIKLQVARRANTVKMQLDKPAGRQVYLGMELQNLGALNSYKLQQLYTGKISETMTKDSKSAVAAGDTLQSVNGITDKTKMLETLSNWTLKSSKENTIDLVFKAANRTSEDLSTLSESMKGVARLEHKGGIVVYEKQTSPMSIIMTIWRYVAEMTRNRACLRILALLSVILLAMTSSMSGVQMPQLSSPILSNPLPFLSSSNTLRTGASGNVADLVLNHLLGEPAYGSTGTIIGQVACGETQVVLRSTAVSAETLQVGDESLRCADGWNSEVVSARMSVDGATVDQSYTVLSCPSPESYSSQACFISPNHQTQTKNRRNNAARRFGASRDSATRRSTANRDFAARRVSSQKTRRRSRY